MLDVIEGLKTFDGLDLAALEREFGPLTSKECALLGNGVRGGAYGWVQTLMTSEIDSTAITNTTTPASMLPPAAVYTAPANLMGIGKVFRFRATGRISNVVTTPGNLTIDVRVGSVTGWTSGTMNLNVVAKTNVSWIFELDATVRSIGNGTLATLIGVGRFASESVVGSPVNTAGGVGELNVPVSAPAVGTGFDSTVTQTIDLRATFSVNTATTSIQTHTYSLEHLTAQ